MDATENQLKDVNTAAAKKADKIMADASATANGVAHLCFDIETGHADEADVVAAHEEWLAGLKKRPLSSDIAEKLKDIRDKSALLDRAPIACVALVTEKVSAVFSCIADPSPVNRMPGVNADIFNFPSERDMLAEMRKWLNERTTSDTINIGFNQRNFDNPKIRNAYIRQRLSPPDFFLPNTTPVFDVMKEFIHNFSTEKSNDKYAKLKLVQQRFGLPQYKHIIEGKDVPDLVKEGKAKHVIPYCYADAMTTYLAFLYMTGKMPDGK
jgi:hypothetical protein